MTATKAELAAELRELRKAHNELILTAASAKRQSTPPTPDPAVTALGHCIAGLDPLAPSVAQAASWSSNYYAGPRFAGRDARNVGEIRRILLYLADRYGVALVDPPNADQVSS